MLQSSRKLVFVILIHLLPDYLGIGRASVLEWLVPLLLLLLWLALFSPLSSLSRTQTALILRFLYDVLIGSHLIRVVVLWWLDKDDLHLATIRYFYQVFLHQRSSFLGLSGEFSHLFGSRGIQVLQVKGIQVHKGQSKEYLGSWVVIDIVASHKEEDNSAYEEDNSKHQEYIVTV